MKPHQGVQSSDILTYSVYIERIVYCTNLEAFFATLRTSQRSSKIGTDMDIAMFTAVIKYQFSTLDSQRSIIIDDSPTLLVARVSYRKMTGFTAIYQFHRIHITNEWSHLKRKETSP